MSAERAVLRWASIYVLGLPERVRAERLAELESDLWEHRSAVGHGRSASVALLTRCARGAADDVAWRIAMSSPRGVARATAWTAAVAAYALLVALHGWLSTGLLGSGAVQGDAADVAYAGRVSASILALLVGGAALISSRPRMGAALVASGAVATPLLFGWAAPALAPIAFAVVGGAVPLARRPADR